MHNRKLEENIRIFDKVESEKSLGKIVVEIPRDTRNGQKERTATLQLKKSEIEIKVPPKLVKDMEKIKL